MKKVVVLGGDGVFGNHTVARTLADPAVEQVVSIGRNVRKHDAFSLGIGNSDPRFQYRQIHIVFEHDRLIEALDDIKPDTIINFAAQGEGAASWKYSWRYFETNATAIARICEDLMKRDYLERWIQISSSEIYGSVKEPITEEGAIQPTSPYAASKAAGDMYLLSISKTQDFPVILVRPSNAYGPGQQLHRIVPRAALFGLMGQKLPLHGGGEVLKSYLYTTDLAEGIHLVTLRGKPGGVYNIGPDDPVKIKKIVELVAAELDMPFDDLVDITDPRFGEDKVYWLDSSLVKNELGWAPSVDLKEGVAHTVKWARENLDYLRRQNSTFEFKA